MQDRLLGSRDRSRVFDSGQIGLGGGRSSLTVISLKVQAKPNDRGVRMEKVMIDVDVDIRSGWNGRGAGCVLCTHASAVRMCV